jgi:3-oxoacyl-[acyl-carrier-protein] synthase-3
MKNSDLESIVETNDDWIIQRTGIRQRHIAGEHETTASLGEMAARAALERANMTPGRYRFDHLCHLDAGQHLSRHCG